MAMPNVLAQGRIPPSLAWVAITTNGVATIKAHGGGVVHTVTVCRKGISGNLATLTLDGVALPSIDTTSNVGTLVLDVGFVDSATIALSAGTAGAILITFY
jgi:starvation-inducible outer membrane lipoprotein